VKVEWRAEGSSIVDISNLLIEITKEKNLSVKSVIIVSTIPTSALVGSTHLLIFCWK
jgi:hypothetical protein